MYICERENSVSWQNTAKNYWLNDGKKWWTRNEIKSHQIKALFNFLTDCELMKSWLKKEDGAKWKNGEKYQLANININVQPCITFTTKRAFVTYTEMIVCPNVSTNQTELKPPKCSRYYNFFFSAGEINDSRTSLDQTSHNCDWFYIDNLLYDDFPQSTSEYFKSKSNQLHTHNGIVHNDHFHEAAKQRTYLWIWKWEYEWKNGKHEKKMWTKVRANNSENTITMQCVEKRARY